MFAEISEVTDFLAHTPPFDAITEEERARLARAATMYYAKAGELAFPDAPAQAEAESGAQVRIVRSGAVNCTSENGSLIDRLGPGEVFPRKLTDHSEQQYRYNAYEDSLLLAIPLAEINELDSNPELDAFFSQVATRRRHSVNELRETSGMRGVADIAALHGTVADVAIPPVLVAPATSIKETAALMVEHNLSSAIVVDHQRLAGILTDSDLRTRVVAAGYDTSAPVADVMTPDPPYTSFTASLFEAMLQLSMARINHLPVIDDDQVRGVLTTDAIMNQLQADPIFAAAQFRDAPPEQLADCFNAVQDVAVRFIDRGATPDEATRLLTMGADQLIARSVELIYQDIGPAPADYCLIAMGSMGRHEMALSSDQDHALILGDDYDPTQHPDYFKQFGEKLSELLEQAGIPLCPGEMMASNPKWRLTVAGWEQEFAQWTQGLGPKALMNAQTFFDMRAVQGNEELRDRVLDAALIAARKDRRFLNELVSLARRREPPLGFFRGFVLDKSGNYANTLDLKRGGITAVVQLARLYAIESWVDEVSTRGRLRAAARAGVISSRRAEDLVDALDVFQMILLASQANQRSEGKETNSRIDPRKLAHLERESLRDAFRLVRSELRSADSRTR